MPTSLRLIHSASTPVAIALAAVIAARAASAADAPSPSPAKATTFDEPPPVRLEDIIVTASALDRVAHEISTPASVLAGSELARRSGATLGGTLLGLPGIDATSFSPGASRPIIRGLGGDRIRVLAGGIGTLDASVISPDHAVAVEPLLIDRVEIIRGPATLLHGGGAVGGIVNVIDNRIPSELPSAPWGGRLETRWGSAAQERAGVVEVDGAAGSVAWRLDGFQRRTDDVTIPGLAPTPELAAAMLAADETPARGTLPNSATASHGATAGVSYVGPRGHLGISHQSLSSRYGLVVEPDVRIHLHQHRWDLEGEWRELGGPWRSGRVVVGLADYHHLELDGPEVGTRFTSRAHEARLELRHERLGPFEGALGLQTSQTRLRAEGDEAFLPPHRSRSSAVFLYEEVVFGPWTLELGSRFERQRVIPGASTGLPRRLHQGETVTAGLVWKPADGDVIALSASRNERAPNAQELFADGPHAGTRAFEVGDPDLRSERSVGVDLSYRRTRGGVTGSVSVFLNRFQGFIHEEATGEHEDDLPVYRFVQRDAEFVGAEGEVTWHVRNQPRDRIDVRGFADTVRATNTRTREPLPRITPFRFGAGIAWERGSWTFAAEWRHVSAPDRLAPGETRTESHHLLHVAINRRIQIRDADVDLFARATNVLDATARMHASFVKDLAPLPGRDITLGLRVVF